MTSTTALTGSPKSQVGDRVAVLSPSSAAPAVAPAVHEQAMQRLTDLTGLIPVEYATTRKLNARPETRAADIMAAFTDPSIRAVLTTSGGDDQITVLPHLDPAVIRANPKPFLGYSDNLNLVNWLWRLGIPGFYGGATQAHLGSGPGVDAIHLRSLRAALLEGGILEITDPGESEDFGPDWNDPAALQSFGDREPTEPWVWAGPRRVVEGRTWGGCLEVIAQLGLAGQLPTVEDLRGAVLLLETSEEVPPASHVMRWVRALGERGILEAVAGVLLARPPVSRPGEVPSTKERRRRREEQAGIVIEQVQRYNSEAVVCTGVPFGHTRPQWIIPHGGIVRLDGDEQRVFADYS